MIWAVRKGVPWMLRMAVATRFHTGNVLRRETIGHHSHGVATLIHILHPGCRKELLVAALLHDLAEGEWGDIPGHTKRRLGIRDDVAQLEATEASVNYLEMPALSEEEDAMLKFADSAHGALYCLEELSRGNTTIHGAFDNFLDWLDKMTLPEPRQVELRRMIKEEACAYNH